MKQGNVFEIYTEHKMESMEAEIRRLRSRIDFLESAYRNARKDLAAATRIAVEKSEEIDRLRAVVDAAHDVVADYEESAGQHPQVCNLAEALAGLESE